MQNRTVWILLTLAATACGTPARTPATASTSSAETTPDAKNAGTSTEAQRDGFMNSCLQGVSSKDYCACAFTQFTEVFRDVDLSKDLPKTDPHFEQLGQRTKENCADKFPEDEAQKTFLQGCVSDSSTRAPYCGCAWSELRKSLSIGEIVNYQPDSPKTKAAKQRLPKECKGKYPALLAENEFLTSCTHEGAAETQCKCMWKKIANKLTIEEIVAETRDITEVPDLDKCK